MQRGNVGVQGNGAIMRGGDTHENTHTHTQMWTHTHTQMVQSCGEGTHTDVKGNGTNMHLVGGLCREAAF